MKSSFKKLKAFVLNPSFLILVILVIASFMRLYRIEDYMTFLGDEGRDVLVAYGILHGKLTLLGPTASVGGFFLGPIYYYLITPFLWIFGYNPVGPAVMVALFGVATVYLVYKFASEFFNLRVGLISAFLYSISPLVILYSKSSWNPNIFPFFSLSCLYLLYKALKTNDYRLFLSAGFLLGICMQLHYLAFFLGAVVGIYVLVISLLRLVFKESKNVLFDYLKQNFLIFIGFLIGLSPFLAFETRHGFTNIKSIFTFIFNSGDTGVGLNFFSNVADVFFRIFARLVVAYPALEKALKVQNINTTFGYILPLAIGISSCLVLLYLLVKSWIRAKKDQSVSDELLKLSLILIWFSLGVILFGFYKKPIYDYYFGFMFMLPFILTAIMLDFLFSKKGFFRIFSIIIFLILVIINLYASPVRNPANRQQEQVREIAELVLEKTENKPFNFALITGGNSDHGYRYFFTVENHPPVTILSPQVDPQRQTVTDQLLVICEGPCEPLGHSLWEVAGFGRAEIVGEWDIIPGKAYRLVHYKE